MDRAPKLTRVQAERRFPHKVDVPIPAAGLGRRLTDMLAWCRENFDSNEWDQHVRKERAAGAALVDLARFYFTSQSDAEAFRQRWF